MTKIPFIRVDGKAPRDKKAATEAITFAPDHVVLIFQEEDAGTGLFPTKKLAELTPGETVPFTDGEGRYYGTITRTYEDAKAQFLVDYR